MLLNLSRQARGGNVMCLLMYITITVPVANTNFSTSLSCRATSRHATIALITSTEFHSGANDLDINLLLTHADLIL